METDKIWQIADYNAFVGAETLHPLVGVVDFSKLPPIKFENLRRLFGYYAIYLKGPKFTELTYGRRTYDYHEGTLVFFAPGQVAGSNDDGEYHQTKGCVLMFHPDLLKGSYLEQSIKRYTFFSYDVNEALCITEQERKLFLDCLNLIDAELHCGDELSKTLIIDYIKVVLDSCTRFYNRQFSVRKEECKDVLEKFEKLLDSYFEDGTAASDGYPSVQYCAGKLCLSTNYFSDLVKKETGISALKHIHRKMFEVAKQRLLLPGATVNDAAYYLGFRYPQHFSNWFKRMAGMTPNEYRTLP